MPIFQQYLFVIGSFQGILLSSLLSFGSQLTNANKILAVWCLLLGLNFSAPLITLENEVNHFTFLIGFFNFLPACYGGLLYLYCRHAITRQHFSLVDSIHFLPLAACYLLNYELLFAAPEIKLNLFVYHQPQSIAYRISEFILFSQSFVYMGMSIALIRKYQNKANETLANFNPGIFRWLWKLLILDCVIWLLKSAASMTSYQYMFSTMGDVLIIIFIYSIAMAQWRDPRLFQIEQLAETSPAESDHESHVTNPYIDDTSQPENHPTNKNGALDPDTRASLLSVVRQAMQAQQLFLDNQLTLSRLAETIGMSTHHLSEVLNQHDGKNFYRFINEYRIEFVCKQLKADPQIKIIDLAMQAGFASKSTFNAVFKQLTGQTPSEYREKLLVTPS